MWCNGNTEDFGSSVQGSNPCIPANLKFNTMILLSIIILIALIGVLLLGIGEPLYAYLQMAKYAECIDKKNTFYLKSNPSITCTITQVQRIAWKEPSVTLSVIYPDKSIGELSFTLKEFKESWIEL